MLVERGLEALCLLVGRPGRAICASLEQPSPHVSGRRHADQTSGKVSDRRQLEGWKDDGRLANWGGLESM